MNPLNTLSELLERPEALAAEPRPAGLGRAGMLGYFAGTLGLFVYLRLFAAVPPGVMSFLAALGLVLAANFLLVGVMHLFLDLTGAGKGSAARLFLAFGLTDYFLALLVPLAFFAKLGVLGAFLWFLLCALLVFYARVRLVRRLYTVSANKAVLSVWLPYAGFCGVFFLLFVYSIAWLVWLVI
jgi:hypothetical protein